MLTCTFVPTASADQTVTVTPVNLMDGECMGVQAGVMADNTKVIQWPCIAGDLDQEWVHSVVGPSLWRNAKNQNYCLAIAGNYKTLPTNIIIWDCQPNNPGQLWSAGSLGGHGGNTQIYSQLTGINTGLTVSGGNYGEGTPIVNWGFSDLDYQTWQGAN